VHSKNFHWAAMPSVSKLGEASLLTFFAYQGSELALAPSGEIQNPRRSVPFAILYATIALILLRSSADGLPGRSRQ
jgi:basic amino acid/polyamine antiporter, APA family